MAATTAQVAPATPKNAFTTNGHSGEDVFGADDDDPSSQSYNHRFSSRFDPEPLDLSSTTSPSQLKRTIEAHLQETDRRLLDTQQLGNSLLRQRDDLTSKLEEVEQFQDEATIPNDLRRRLADIEREHADVGREVARALIGPKPVQDESQVAEPGVFTSQGSGSPTKISAPSRRHRNQPSTRAGDLQFAADISTSLLAQVRQLQSAVAERDETIRRSQAERETIEHDLLAYTQKVRALDESEQRYKDENWNLESQRHELLNAAKDAQDREKRLNASLGSAMAANSKLQNDLDEIRLTHSKLSEEHTATRKAHDTEIHSLKRNADMADTDRLSLQVKIDELVNQNQELAKAVASRSRSRQISPSEALLDIPHERSDRVDSPDDSPPPSPTKGTPRHGGLESETLRSSLHHAHRMIQNLKGNIHREKTEKIELKRMLQDARDELEHRRGGDSGSAAKKQKTKPDAFKKPARPDMLGGSRRARTDVELSEDDWEDANMDSPSHPRPTILMQPPRGRDSRMTDLSDAYQTANDTEGTFDTADERNTTESEAFMTGAESMAGDSTDELTETEDNASKSGRPAPGRVGRSSLAPRSADARSPYLTGDDAEIQTPMQPSFTKFKLRNGRGTLGKQGLVAQESTPGSARSTEIAQDSPATVMTVQSPPEGEQSLFAELGGMDEINSDTHSTPARSSTMSSTHSTPGFSYTPSKSNLLASSTTSKFSMVDSGTMTDEVLTDPSRTSPDAPTQRSLLPSALPLLGNAPSSPSRHQDSSTQFTPHRNSADSPNRPTSSHITPPKTVWDAAQESSPARDVSRGNGPDHIRDLGFSGVLSQDTLPGHSPTRDGGATQEQLKALQADLATKEAELGNIQANHAAVLAAMQQEISDLKFAHDKALDDTQALSQRHQKELEQKHGDLENLRLQHDTTLGSLQVEMEKLKTSHTTEAATLREEIEAQRVAHGAKERELADLADKHTAETTARQQELQTLHSSHATELTNLNRQVSIHREDLDARHSELETIRASHTTALAATAAELENLRRVHSEEKLNLRTQLSDHQATIAAKESNLEAMESGHIAEINELQRQIARYRDNEAQKQTEIENLRSHHATEIDSTRKQLNAHQEEISRRQEEITTLQATHAATLATLTADAEKSKNAHAVEIDRLNGDIATHTAEVESKRNEIERLHLTHSEELEKLKAQVSGHTEQLGNRETQLATLQSVHNAELEGLRREIAGHSKDVAAKQTQLDALQKTHDEQTESLKAQLVGQSQVLDSKHAELDSLRLANEQELNKLTQQLAGQTEELALRTSKVEGLQAQLSARNTDLTKSNTELDSHKAELAGLVGTLATTKADLDKHRTQLASLNNAVATKQSEVEDHKSQAATLRSALATRQAELDASQAGHMETVGQLREQILGRENDLRSKQSELESLENNHQSEVQRLQTQISESAQLLEGVQQRHTEQLNNLQALVSAKSMEIEELKKELEQLRIRQTVTSQGYSGILSQHTQPLSPSVVDPAVSTRAETVSESDRPRTAEKIVGGGMLAAAAGTLGFKAASQDSTIQNKDDVFAQNGGRPVATRDQGSQNSVSGRQSGKSVVAPVITPSHTQNSRTRSPHSPTRYPRRPGSRTRDVMPIAEDETAGPSSPPPRPASAGSVRTASILSQQHPPLPSDHQDMIAKANSQVGSPTRRESGITKQGVIMGPPTLPASAMRRPKTPSESIRTANRVSVSANRAATGSRMSRRSSVSSFASELDERFNIRAEQQGEGFEGTAGTDPRMIQAITQTMIGEHLWKYTRKAGSKETSNNRHRRYFWVHPYTKTLYWSTQDPQTAGGSQLNAKSVQIQSVRVVRDDNPMPPGLHRKSLEITTLGRKIKITASTGQRHETWFNALSYLLHRGEEPLVVTTDADGSGITNDDIAEFNVNGYGARLVPQSRMSMSSYNSRTTAGTSRRVGRQSLPPGATLSSSTSQQNPGQVLSTTQGNNETVRASRLEVPGDKDRTLRASSRSRISKMFGSMTGKGRSDNGVAAVDSGSQSRESGSIYDASLVSDSRKDEEEEAKEQRAQQEKPGLEDVRACCDGKHHVGSLAHRQVPTPSASDRITNAINRSMSRRT